ncbi:MAG: carboxypeptidase regulatory-like domain-containing protein [Thermoanaerobaculia bacterium]
MPKRLPWMVGAIAVVAVCLFAVPAVAQFGSNTGGISGKVVDEQGGVLPGVAVTLSEMGAAQTVYTDARGEFNIRNLAPGNYKLTLALQGFSTVNRENVTVSLGRDTELSIPMKLSAVAATVTVSGEVPVISTKKVETGAAITQEELKMIPSARDPWVVLQSIPGVIVDRVNVAGSESGQQSAFAGKGSTAGSFSVDGVNLTDMAALGASAGYYDFDSFQEMQVISGGADAAIAGSGTHLNMVTKRGTNEVHGSARIFVVDDHFESENKPEGAAGISSGNRIQSLQDYGVEVGGPVWKDHIWLWGAYGRDQINLVTANGLLDRTTLEDFNAKLNWQVVPSNSVDVWYLRSDKIKFGRNAGLTRPPETAWNQTTPANTWKIADSQILGSNFFFTAQYNGVNGDFTLDPVAGPAPQVFLDEGGVWHNSYVIYAAPRPQRQVKSDISYFFNAGNVGNELKAGFGYLTAGARSFSIWPGDGSNFNGEADGLLVQMAYGDKAGSCAVDCVAITRPSGLSIMNKYWSAYLQDAITFDRLTVNLGVRWDQQYGENRPSQIVANPSFPALLPAIDFEGTPKQFTWNDWQPRVGLSYALGTNRTTVIKASYSRYAEALGTNTTGQTNPTNAVAYTYYAWNDANGNNLVEESEVGGFLDQTRNFDPDDPGAVSSPNSFSSDFHAPRTWEIVAGIDHELLPAFAVGVAYTHREFTDQLFRFPTGITRDDYFLAGTVSGTLPDSLGGGAYEAPFYEIDPAIVPPGYTWTNRPDFSQTYDGFDFILTKRLSHRWMLRGSFSYNINKQHLKGPGACVDPTNTAPGRSADIGNPQAGYTAETCADDTYVATSSFGSGAKDSVFLNAKWQFYLNALYQLPLNFAFAAAVWGREGYPIVPFRRVAGEDGYVRDVVARSVDETRYDNVFELDLRLEKLIPITATANVTVSADLFNVTNENTVLQRFNRLNRSNTGNIKEIQSPRVLRFGARISF